MCVCVCVCVCVALTKYALRVYFMYENSWNDAYMRLITVCERPQHNWIRPSHLQTVMEMDSHLVLCLMYLLQCDDQI